MMEQIRAVARNTFTESIRQPIFLVLLLLGIGLLAINPALSAYTLGDDNKLLLDLGLSTLLLAGMFLAAFTSTGVLSDEIERRTVLT
ncbi:MAG: ABC transporter permease, partial [Planctomycetota bacterium]